MTGSWEAPETEVQGEAFRQQHEELYPAGDVGPLGNVGDETKGPPPPYESVVMSSADVSRPSNGAHMQPMETQSAFEITVTDPVKQGDGVGRLLFQAYVSYKVCTTTTMQHYRSNHPEVIRRFRDFAWLKQQLQEQNRGIIVPPIPEKNAIQKYQMTTEFIEQRRQALQMFINRVAAHPVLSQSKELQLFLEANEQEWAMEISRAQFEVNGSAKKRLAGALQVFKDLGASTASLIGGKNHDEEEDPEYLKVREYVSQLEGHLVEANRQSARLIKRQTELGSSLADFGRAMISLGKFEAGGLADAFVHMGERSEELSRTCTEQSAALGASFEAPLKEAVRLIKSAKATMADRSSALAALQGARDAVEHRRTKVTKLRGTPGIKEEKVSEAERELNEAQQKVETAKGTYEMIVQRMSDELSRFQKERANEMKAVLHDFAVAQAQLATETAAKWRTLI